jgi:tryptophanyl-tRNA synthetase
MGDDHFGDLKKQVAEMVIAHLEPFQQRYREITTDSRPSVDFDTAGPGVLNLISIYQAFSGEPDDAIKAKFAGLRYGDLKKQVAEMVIAHLEPFQQRYREITADPAYLASVLRDGAQRVAPIANQTVHTVKQRMGLYT